MPTTLIAHTAASFTSADSNATSGTINTTGATLLVVVVSDRTDTGGASVITDSKSNTWHGLTEHISVGALLPRSRIFYASNPTVGTLHTFTATSNGSAPFTSFAVLAFDNIIASPFDQENGSGISATTGPITPLVSGELIIVGAALNGSSTSPLTIDSGLTISDQTTWSSGVRMGVAAAYKVQASAKTINATWTGLNGSDSIASFKSVPPELRGNFLVMAGFSEPEPTTPHTAQPVLCSAGELFVLETAQDFVDGLVQVNNGICAYQYRKHGVTNDARWIQGQLKTDWPEKISVGYEVWLDLWLDTIQHVVMVLENAANQAEKYVTVYTEEPTGPHPNAVSFMVPDGFTTGLGIVGAGPAVISAMAGVVAAHPTKQFTYDGVFIDTAYCPTPQYLASIPTLLAGFPFNGMSVLVRPQAQGNGDTGDYSYRMMSSDTLSLDTMRDTLAPLLTANLGNATHNYARALMAPLAGNSGIGLTQIDPFDSDTVWAKILNNVGIFCKAIREVGLKGILLDNEDYANPGWDKYEYGKYTGTYSLEQYQDQMTLRGQQVMATMVSEFPDIEVLWLVVPETSVPQAPDYPHTQLNGAFFAGMMSASKTPPLIVPPSPIIQPTTSSNALSGLRMTGCLLGS